MTASCHLLQLSFPKNPILPSFRPIWLLSRRSLSVCSSAFLAGLPAAAAAAAPLDPSSVHLALRHAHVLFFKSGYNVQIVVDEDEPEEVLLRRFRREVYNAGVIQECKRRRYFENKQEEKKQKAREAGRCNRRRRFNPRFAPTSPSSSDAPKNTRDDADDNWEMPEGSLPL